MLQYCRSSVIYVRYIRFRYRQNPKLPNKIYRVVQNVVLILWFVGFRLEARVCRVLSSAFVSIVHQNAHNPNRAIADDGADEAALLLKIADTDPRQDEDAAVQTKTTVQKCGIRKQN